MDIKTIPVDVSEERRILARMCTQTEVLARLVGVAKPELFEAPFARTVASWVWEYWNRLHEAPGKAMEDVFLANRKMLNDDDAALVAQFLKSASAEADNGPRINVQYAVDTATSYFRRRGLLQLSQRIDELASSGRVSEGEALVGSFIQVGENRASGVRLLSDSKAIIHAFNREETEVFRFRGALGDAVGPISRGDFVAVMGPMKRGKSWWLWYFAHRGALLGLKTLFISLEMSEAEVVRRAWQSFLGRPEHSGPVPYPRFEAQGDRWVVVQDTRTMEGVPTSKEEVEAAQAKFSKHCRTGDVHIEVFPAGSASLADIEACLTNLELYQHYVPDIVVIDYADLLRPQDPRLEVRHQLDVIWKRLRGLAQEKQCVVVTASQSGRRTLKKDVGADDFAEDIRKAAHVTHLITLSSTDVQKEQGILRVQCPLKRSGRTTNDQVVVLTGYDIGRTYLDSRFLSQVTLPDAFVEGP